MEGHVAIRRLLVSPLVVRSVLVSPRGARLLEADLARVGAPVYEAAPDVVEAIVGFDLHRGSLAIAGRPPAPTAAAAMRGAAVVVVLESVNDAENLGAIARAAVALGADALLLSPDCADPLSRRAIRVSMGHVLALPVAHLTPWPGGLDRLREDGWRTIALSPDPAAPPLARAVAEDPPRVALLLGAEGAGLSDAALEAAGGTGRIPMVAGVDSLNVAHAAAIALSHLGRAARPHLG